MDAGGVTTRNHVLRALPPKLEHHRECAGHGLVRKGCALVKLQAMLGIEGRRLGEEGELPLPVWVHDCARTSLSNERVAFIAKATVSASINNARVSASGSNFLPFSSPISDAMPIMARSWGCTVSSFNPFASSSQYAKPRGGMQWAGRCDAHC